MGKKFSSHVEETYAREAGNGTKTAKPRKQHVRNVHVVLLKNRTS